MQSMKKEREPALGLLLRHEGILSFYQRGLCGRLQRCTVSNLCTPFVQPSLQHGSPVATAVLDEFLHFIPRIIVSFARNSACFIRCRR
jgi:hypothetical protein